MHDRAFFIQKNIATLGELLPYAAERGVGIMLENLPATSTRAQQLGELLDPLPELGLHLDIGHANLMVLQSTVNELLAAYGSRLRHVHLHDNKGGGGRLALTAGHWVGGCQGSDTNAAGGGIRCDQLPWRSLPLTATTWPTAATHSSGSGRRKRLQETGESTSRTLAASSSGVNGLGRNSSTPPR
jgi:hypothetical protein